MLITPLGLQTPNLIQVNFREAGTQLSNYVIYSTRLTKTLISQVAGVVQ